jgi:hypothetical protein
MQDEIFPDKDISVRFRNNARMSAMGITDCSGDGCLCGGELIFL